jgi:YHS domain-containing protein
MNTRGRLSHNEPLESVRRVSLQDRIDRWIGRGMAWLIRRLMTVLLRKVTPPATSGRNPDVPRPAIALHRDPWCGTYVSPEISFPLEQAGQMLHFCSAECRTRYQQTSQRAASA